MEINGKDVYFVAVKALVKKDNQLLITHDIFGSWDLPGGRIKKDEFKKPLEEVLQRKIKEELGDKFKYIIGEPSIFFRHERKEQGIDRLVRIFAVGFEVKYVSGDVVLGKNHDKYQWVDLKTFQPESYFEGGWLKGVEEYMEKK